MHADVSGASKTSLPNNRLNLTCAVSTVLPSKESSQWRFDLAFNSTSITNDHVSTKTQTPFFIFLNELMAERGNAENNQAFKALHRFV